MNLWFGLHELHNPVHPILTQIQLQLHMHVTCGELVKDTAQVYCAHKNGQKKVLPSEQNKEQSPNIEVTSNALSTCSGAIVLFSSLPQTSLDSDEIRLINSANA